MIRLRLPALRERSEDIPLLTRHFLQKSARDLGVEPKRVSEEALAYLASLPFPGNVRQLENLANWLTVMAPAQTIEIKDLPPDLGPAQAGATDASTGGGGSPIGQRGREPRGHGADQWRKRGDACGHAGRPAGCHASAHGKAACARKSHACCARIPPT